MSASRKAGYYWVKYVSQNHWSIEYWNGGMWFTRNPHLVEDSMFSTIDETPIVREGNITKDGCNCNKPAVINSLSDLDGKSMMVKFKVSKFNHKISLDFDEQADL